MMRWSAYLVVLLFSLPSSSEILVLAVGQSVLLTPKGNAPIQVSSRRSIQVLNVGTKLKVWGKRVGTATISQGPTQWLVHVLNKPEAEVHRLFQDTLSQMMGLTLDIEGGEVVIHGTLLKANDWKALARLSQETGGKWKMRARMDSHITPGEISDLLAIRGQSAIHLEFDPWPQLQGPLAPSESRRLEPFGVDMVSEGQNQPQSALRLELTLTEVRRSTFGRLGLTYEDGQVVRVLPEASGPNSFEAKLNFLAGQGDARILARPTLVTRPGSEAEFLAGGEFAVKTSNFRNKDVTWKRYGLWLKFRPTWKSSEVAGLKIESEFSHPDYSQSVDGIPSLKTNRSSAEVDLAIGRTLLLSGLVSEHDGGSSEGLSGLKEIPLIGVLFRSKDYVTQNSEFLIFVKATIVNPREP